MKVIFVFPIGPKVSQTKEVVRRLASLVEKTIESQSIQPRGMAALQSYFPSMLEEPDGKPEAILLDTEVETSLKTRVKGLAEQHGVKVVFFQAICSERLLPAARELLGEGPPSLYSPGDPLSPEGRKGDQPSMGGAGKTRFKDRSL